MVKNPPAMRETQDQSLGREDTLEKEMAIHSNIPMARGSWQATVHGVAKSWTPLSDWHLLTSAIRTSQVVQWYAGDAGSIPGSGMEEEVVATPVFLLGKSHERRSLEGYSPVCDSGCKQV